MGLIGNSATLCYRADGFADEAGGDGFIGVALVLDRAAADGLLSYDLAARGAVALRSHLVRPRFTSW